MYIHRNQSKYGNGSKLVTLYKEYMVMTNLGNILKSRGITLSTKIRVVKAMVFPVVMYGCKSWTIQKTEH